MEVWSIDLCVIEQESGVDESATSKSQFAGAEVTHGSAASGAGDNRDIPLSEGGDVDPKTGRSVNVLSPEAKPITYTHLLRLYKAGDFEGVGGPEDKARIYAENNPGDDEVGGNVRQQSNIKDSGGKSKESARPMVNPSGPGRT